jgi:peptide/nickel transport system permease protein
MSTHFLWTDECFLFVLIVSLILIIRGLRKEHIRRAVLSIFKKPIAMSASIILFFFLVIGVLDSVHVTTATLSGTILDRILAPLGDQYEKTYSAPLALTLFSSETVFIDGHAQQVHPRLIYPPQTLQTEHEKWHLVSVVVDKALLMGLLAILLTWGILIICRRLLNGSTSFTLQGTEVSAFITLFLCIAFVMGSYWLSRDLHILGTGKIGQDIFYYAVKSIRTGLVIGILTTLFMMPLALLLGIAAGYFGGIIDDIIQYIYTTLSSIPGVLLITASVLSMQTYIANHPEQFKTLAENADSRLLALCLILGVTSWTSLCRLLRAEALKLREVDYVLAAIALGSSSFKIIYKHLLPNVMHIVIITLVLDFSFLVLAEAVLSYVGVGVSPMTISWGNMINAARLELAREPVVWWPMMAAFMFMFMLVLASNLFADAVRDAFDPHQVK